MYKASELIRFAKQMVGMPYWYGTVVYKCTEDLLTRKSKQYSVPKYTHYKSSRMSRYRSDISKKLVCTDCVGLIKGFFWTDGGKGVIEAIGTSKSIKSKYAGNGCPDKSADGMLSWCKSSGCKNGSISTLPDVPGVLLFSPGHVGIYIGGGSAIEARGFDYGVVETKVSQRGWKNWAYLPSSLLEYDTIDGSAQDSVESIKLGDRTIEKGTKGEDVAELQRELMSLGYDLGVHKDDGDCGSKTVTAIKKFQSDNSLTASGKYDKKTHEKLMAVLNGGPQLTVLRVTGDTVNVRSKPNTATGVVTYRVHKGDLLTSVGVDAETRWFKLVDGNYISYKYVQQK